MTLTTDKATGVNVGIWVRTIDIGFQPEAEPRK